MPVGLVLNFPGLSIQDRDLVAKALDFPDHWPDGCLAHGAGDSDAGLLLFEIWSSRDDFERFYEERLQWAFREALGTAPPRPRITQVELSRVEAPKTYRAP